MNSKYLIGAFALVSVALSGCSSPAFVGPPRLVRLAHIDGAVGAPSFECNRGVFTGGSAAGEDDLLRHNLGYQFSEKVCASMYADEANAETRATAMLESGFTLVKVRCNDFFAVKASNQTTARLLRSLLQPLTVAITSTFSVIDFGSESEESDALALLAAGSALAGAGIDIYEEQFLFDADNIDAVRGLTMRALDAHRTEVLARDPDAFDPAVRQLVDHQMICTPASILGLVRNAIDSGEIRARQQTADGDEEEEPAIEEAAEETPAVTGEQVSLEPAT